MVLLALAIAGLSAAAAKEPFPEWAELRDLLKAEDFVALEERLERLVVAFEAGDDPDENYAAAFRLFGRLDVAWKGPLNDWVATRPDSYAAHYARSEYLRHLGWTSRGREMSSSTPQARIQRMRALFNAAREDTLAVIRLRPGLAAPYGNLVNIAMMGGDIERIDEIKDQGLAVFAGSAEVLSFYMHSLKPWWGGRTRAANDYPSAGPRRRLRIREDNYYALGEFLDWEVAPLIERYPHLQRLRGYMDYTISNPTHLATTYDDALTDIERALKVAPGDGIYLQRKAEILRAAGRHQEALEVIDGYLESQKPRHQMLVLKARILTKLNRKRESLALWDQLLRDDPHDPLMLYYLARTHNSRHDHKAVATTLERALVFGSEDDDVRYWLGSEYMLLGDHALAAKEFEAATILMPVKPKYYYWHARALIPVDACAARLPLKKFLILCQAKSCDLAEKGWAEATSLLLSRAPKCASR